MKKNILNIAVAATLGFVAFSASAEDMYRGAWYAVPGASYTNPDSDLESRNDGAGIFLRMGKELSESWDIQFGISQARTGNDLNGVGGRYRQSMLGADALYFFSRDKFRPFVLAGLGVARNRVNYDGIDLDDKSKTSPYANVGLGAQYLITDNFGLQADVRHVWSKAGTQSINADAGRLNADETVGNTYVNLGAIFRFGAPAPVAMAEPTPEPVAHVAVAVAPEPEPVQAALPVVPACNEKFQTVEVSAEKLFGFDKSKLADDGKAELDAAIEKIKAHPALVLVLVTGHTDRIGSEAYNQKLSERRANQVKEYMVANGVDASRLQAAGKGESEPVVGCEGLRGKAVVECLAPNRRVVISAEEKIEAGCK